MLMVAIQVISVLIMAGVCDHFREFVRAVRIHMCAGVPDSVGGGR
jgi:uncharacterized membrane protein YdcZ (DUF606 family)